MVDLALDLVIILEVPPAQGHTMHEVVFGHGVSGSYFLGYCLKVHWSVGEGGSVAVDIVGDFSVGVDAYGPEQFFVAVVETVHVDAHLPCLYYVDLLHTRNIT